MITGRSPIPAINVREAIVSDLFRGVSDPSHDTRCSELTGPADHYIRSAWEAANLSWVARGNTPPGVREYGPASRKLAHIILGYAICKATSMDGLGTTDCVKLARKVTAMNLRARRVWLRAWNADASISAYPGR